MTQASDFGNRIEPTFPTESPPEHVVPQKFNIAFSFLGTPQVRLARGAQQRDDALLELAEAGITEYEITEG